MLQTSLKFEYHKKTQVTLFTSVNSLRHNFQLINKKIVAPPIKAIFMSLTNHQNRKNRVLLVAYSQIFTG